MRDFLQKHGVMGAAAQRLLEQHGSLTEERVRQDPYTALSKSSPGSTFRLDFVYCFSMCPNIGFLPRVLHFRQWAAAKAVCIP